MGPSIRKMQKVVVSPHVETGDAKPPSLRALIVTLDDRAPTLHCIMEFGDPSHHPRWKNALDARFYRRTVSRGPFTFLSHVVVVFRPFARRVRVRRHLNFARCPVNATLQRKIGCSSDLVLRSII